MITAIIFVLLILLGIGLPLTLWIAPGHHLLGRLGLSYLLGIGIFTLLMFITNLLGFRLTSFNDLLIFIVVSMPLIFFQRGKIKDFLRETGRSIKEFQPDSVEKITSCAIAYFVFSSLASTLYWPVYIWDALTLYDFRAKLFVQIGVISKILNDGYLLGYPLFTSLSHTIVYLAGGDNPQFIYSLFYLSLGLVFYGLSREFVSRKVSLLFTLMLLTTPQIFGQSIVSYTNLPCMTYFSLGALYFYVWDHRRKSGYLIISAILVGLSTWTRSVEPFWLVIFGLVALSAIYRKKLLDILIFAVFFFPIQQIWTNFVFSNYSGSSTLTEVTQASSLLINIFNLTRWGEVIIFLYNGVVIHWGPIFILFLVSFIYVIFAKRFMQTFLIYLISFSLVAMIFVGTFIFSFTFSAWSQIPDSASRSAMVVYPVFIYATAMSFSKLVKHE